MLPVTLNGGTVRVVHPYAPDPVLGLHRLSLPLDRLPGRLQCNGGHESGTSQKPGILGICSSFAVESGLWHEAMHDLSSGVEQVGFFLADMSDDYLTTLAILEVHGVTAVKAGNLYKIVPMEGARERAVPTIIGATPDPARTTDEVITQIVPVSFRTR